MLHALNAFPAPYGGAVLLELQAEPHAHALILATPDAQAPDPIIRDGARLVHQGPLMQARTTWRTVNPVPGQNWYSVLDFATEALPDGEDVYYHAYQMTDDGYSDPLTVTSTPLCVRETVVQLLRDYVRPRLAYHLTRGLESGAIHATAGIIPILEQEVLEEGYSVPVVLIKESATPDPSQETIGKVSGDWQDGIGGRAHREYRHGISGRIDVLLITDNPRDRAEIGAFLHGVLLQDLPFYEAVGLQGTEVQRFDRHEIDPTDATNLYITELTLTASSTVVTREELRYTVRDNGASGTAYFD